MKALLVCPLLSKIRQISPNESKQSFTSCKFNNYIINKQIITNLFKQKIYKNIYK